MELGADRASQMNPYRPVPVPRGEAKSMKVLYAASELFPLAKTGGLADVAAALPSALARLGADVRLVLPGYPSAIEKAQHLREAVPAGMLPHAPDARVLATVTPHTGLPLWIVDCPSLFGRSGGLYQDEEGHEWPDNAARFALFSHAAATIATELWNPDVVHANDWHAGLVPLLLQNRADRRPGTVFTIHNLAYQGLFPSDVLGELDLPDHAYEAMEFHGRVSFLKAGLSSADLLTTVSPNYATEIIGEEFGCGFQGLLAHRRERLSGIMNGADYGVWDPRTDLHLPRAYGPGKMAGKRMAKLAVQEMLGLPVDEEVPVLAFLSRLDHQKMPDVVAEALPALLEDGVQFLMAAEGQGQFEERFRELAAQFPAQVAIRHYSEALAHRVLAAADILLHPARYEPCGLVPIYAMRYGTIPVVRRIGGMVDSVTEVTASTLQSNSATGFFFEEPNAAALLEATRRALSYFGQPIIWRKIQRAAVGQDFSWTRSAQAYLELYRSLRDGTDAPAEAADASTKALTA